MMMKMIMALTPVNFDFSAEIKHFILVDDFPYVVMNDTNTEQL